MKRIPFNPSPNTAQAAQFPFPRAKLRGLYQRWDALATGGNTARLDLWEYVAEVFPDIDFEVPGWDLRQNTIWEAYIVFTPVTQE